MKKSKLLLSLVSIALATILSLLSFNKVKADYQYVVVDDFGQSLDIRSLSENTQRVTLNNFRKPYSDSGIAVSLKNNTSERGYITYETNKAKEVDVSFVINQSTISGHHGWGISLGVTEIPGNNPLCNVDYINLNRCWMIYLSYDGIPFIHHEENGWMVYSATKYSFMPYIYGEDKIPQEVVDKKYPMFEVEVYQNDEWVVLDNSMDCITNIQYLGGDKEYNETITIQLPDEAYEKFRIGFNYIRKTAECPSDADRLPDTESYVTFPIGYSSAIAVTKVEIKSDEEIPVVKTEGTRTSLKVASDKTEFYFGEQFSTNNIEIKEVYTDETGVGYTVDTDRTDYTIDSTQFNSTTAGIYMITVTLDDVSGQYAVEVLKPNELRVEAGGEIEYNNGAIDENKLTVYARTNMGTQKNPDWKEVQLQKSMYTIDLSKVNKDVNGTYEGIVKMLVDRTTVTGKFDVVVKGNEATPSNPVEPNQSSKGCKSFVSISSISIILIIFATTTIGVIRHEKKHFI